MIDFYNAFISYKHGPLDNKVAAHIQSQLEHFHIPGKIRKKTGKKHIQRIFRDKDELPITSNLSDTIEDALVKSEYLIVICSPETKNSVWVQREIEFFLKHHDQEHILTVLTEGEPQDVLPQVLLQEEVSVRQPDGNTYTYLREKEPLCCDYRMAMKKADKEELPRLAAALIGCSYDELMNRRRAYQMQRVTVLGLILTTLALGFSAYVVRNNMKLQKSYDDTLRNQSLYLANESEKLLANEQRIEAIQLALAALPTDGSDRPVTSEAIRALTDATLAYTPVSGTSIHTVWNYRAPSRILGMVLSPKRSSLACRDELNTVTVWDTETHEVLMEKSFGRDVVYSLSYLDDHELLITTAHEYMLYDVSKGKSIWSKTLREGTLRMMDPLIAGDADSFYLISLYYDVYHISAEDGKTLDTHHFPDSTDIYDTIAYDDYQLSPDGKRIAVSMSAASGSGVGMLVLADDDFITVPLATPDVRDICWIDNDRVVLCCYDYFSGQNTLYTDIRVITPQYNMIYCIDLSSQKELWAQEFVFNASIKSSDFLNLPVRGAVAFFCGDVLKVFDIETGEVLNSYDLNYSLVHANDNDQDGTPVFITADGYLGAPVESLGPNTASLTNDFTGNIYQALMGGGVYILQEYSNQILFYDVYVADEEWTEMDEDIVLNVIRDDNYLDDNYLVVSSIMSSGPCITAYDAQEQELLWQIFLDEDIGTEYEVLGVFEDELYVACRHDYKTNMLLRIDMEDGEIIEEEELCENSIALNRVCSFDGNYLTYIYYDEKAKGHRIRMRDLESGKEEKFVLSNNLFAPQSAPRYFKEADAIYYSDITEGDCIVDVAEHEDYEVKLPDDWSGTTVVSVNSTGDKWIISDGAHVLELDREGKVLLEIETNGLVPIGASFYQFEKGAEYVVIVYDDGSMIRYLAADGAFAGKSSVETYPGQNTLAELHFSSDMKTLFIDTGTITDVVETDTWVEVAVIWNSLGYHENCDIFFAFAYKSSKDFHVGYFRHYTLQDLIDKANAILGGAQLSDEQKSQYGIK